MTFPPLRALQVSLPETVVGGLHQTRSGQVDWVAESTWLQQGQRPRLGLDFLRNTARRSSFESLPAWFDNLLPERDTRLRARLADRFGLREGQSFQLLRALGAELPGAVVASPLDESLQAPSSQPHESDPGAGISPPVEHADRLSSLTGMQLKFSMSWVHDRLVFGARTSHREWIVKLPGDYEELAEVEAATMRWAKLAGFTVPSHNTRRFEELVGVPAEWAAPAEQTVFVIERFDRRLDGTRIHHEDFCQALDQPPTNKYGDGKQGFRYDALVRLVNDTSGEAQAREFVQRLGFVIASGNNDAHLKNWAFLWGTHDRPVLSPCYDLVCTIAWERFGWQRKGGPRLALRLGPTRRFADLDSALLSSLSQTTGHSWVAEELRHGIQRARDSLPALDLQLPERMLQALREHWKRVPILRELGALKFPR